MKLLKDIGEFGLIERISKKLKIRTKDLLVGIGDDACAFKSSKNVSLLTTDILIENVHFTLSISPEYIGWKAIASSISDIAAMGGTPKYALISIGLKETMPIKFVDRIYNGIEECCNRFKITVVGGDTVSSPECVVINVTLFGETEKKNIIRRSGAKEGDKIFVTGFLGDVSVGMISSRFFKQIPRVKEARILLKFCKLTSMIDVSDGLANEINHIAKESNVGAIIYKDKLPLSKFLLKSAHKLKKDPYDFALYGGEDYELLFTAGKDASKEKIENLTGTKITWIGEILNKDFDFAVKIIDKDGKEEKLREKAYEHFKSKTSKQIRTTDKISERN